MKANIQLELVDKSKYTSEQLSVISCEFDDTLVVNAFAGTGKTHTLVGYAQARPEANILYLAYNQSIKLEAIEKFKQFKNVTVKTTHGLAYRQYIELFKDRFEKHGMQLSVKIIAEQFCDDVEKNNRYYYAFVLSKLLKDFVYSAFTVEEFIEELIDNSDYYTSKYKIDMAYFMTKFPYFWNEVIENDELPFEHDFYLKLYQLDEPYLEHFTDIILDEAQDTNDCVLNIIEKQTTSRKVYIGDTYQQVYGFRGASDALSKVIKNSKDKCKNLFLTKSFRCSQEIAEQANDYLQISGSKKNFIGNSDIKDDEAGYKEEAIIGRNNIHLFQYAAFNTGDKKLFFVGGFNSYNFYDLLDLVKLRYKKPGEKKEIYNPFYASFQNFEELKEYAEESNDTELLSKIKVSVSVPKLGNEIFNVKQRTVKKQEDADLILTSAHKSKGLEWDSVKLLKGFIDLSVTDIDDIEQEEVNLLYVAITRAKKRLLSDTTLVTNELTTVETKKGDTLTCYLPSDEIL